MYMYMTNIKLCCKMDNFRTMILFFLILVSFKDSRSEVSPSVTTLLGKVNGETLETVYMGNTYHVDRYLGIPYAKPPTGERRFKKPEFHEPFTAPYNAVKVGPSCPQNDFLSIVIAEEIRSEDCLSLNIYVPRQKPDEKAGHAVLFFIHGGGFTMGAGSLARAEVLAAVGNIVVVTINYRLGLLGFLDINDRKSPGNFGLWDQRLALQWVNKHIGAFGGDKDRVTLFGESAGSMSVAFQMLYPQNKGLFRSGITQSGSPTICALFFSDSNIEKAKYFAENLNCSVENTEEIFNCLYTANSDDIIAIVADIQASGDIDGSMKLINSPTVDGDFIKTGICDLFKKAEKEPQPEVDFFRSLKLINGINGAEGTMFLMMLGNADNMEELEVTREQMITQHIPGTLSLNFGFQRNITDVVKDILMSEYTDWKKPDDPKHLREQLVRFNSDWFFNVPGIEMSRVHSNGSNVDSFLYSFVALLEKHFLKTPTWIKTANHGDEIAPVFGYNIDYENVFSKSDYVPPNWELELSKRIMIYWSNFAKSGDPNKPETYGESSLIWPKYNIASQKYIKFDRKDSLGQYLYAKEFNLWRNILPEVLKATDYSEKVTYTCNNKETDTCEKSGNCEGQ